MKTKEECMELIKSCADTLRHRFGVSSFRLFGSVAREEQQADSDVDMCVEMEAPPLGKYLSYRAWSG